MQIPRPRGAPAATDGVCDRRRCPAYVAGAEVVEAYDPIGVPSRLPFQARGEGAGSAWSMADVISGVYSRMSHSAANVCAGMRSGMRSHRPHTGSLTVIFTSMSPRVAFE